MTEASQQMSQQQQLLAPFWKRACSRFSATATTSCEQQWWNKICTMMAVPTNTTTLPVAAEDSNNGQMIRAYHNLHHVYELCQLYENHVLKQEKNESAAPAITTDEDVIFLAAFFHDLVYDAKKPDNEELSADMWLAFCKECNVPNEIESQVKNITLATKKHLEWKAKEEEDAKNNNENNNTLIFLDMDLAILGAPQERYEEYAKQIRVEWRHVPDEDFCKGRAHFLSGMLERPKLFRSSVFDELRGKQCAKNMAWEFDMLSAKIKK